VNIDDSWDLHVVNTEMISEYRESTQILWHIFQRFFLPYAKSTRKLNSLLAWVNVEMISEYTEINLSSWYRLLATHKLGSFLWIREVSYWRSTSANQSLKDKEAVSSYHSYHRKYFLMGTLNFRDKLWDKKEWQRWHLYTKK
jgi:hypothetical protein